MKLEREYLEKIVQSKEDVVFLEKVFSEQSQYLFLDRVGKNLKKQVMTAIKFEKFIDGSLSAQELIDDLNPPTGDINVTYKGYFIKGNITLANLHDMLSFFGCNNNPKQDSVNNAMIFSARNYRIFVSVSEYQNNNKNIAFLYVNESEEELKSMANTYFDTVEELREMNDDDILKLSYDIKDFPYTDNAKDYETNNDYITIQNALYGTYNDNPFDQLLTLALTYRLRNLGWDSNYINFASDAGKAFNILNATTNIRLSKSKIQSLVDTKYLDEKYDLTEMGRVALTLLNYFTPISTNNFGNFYAPLVYYSSIKEIDKKNFVSLTFENQVLYGLLNEFYVSEECLDGMSKSGFNYNSENNLSTLNLINEYQRCREIGYTPNIQVAQNENLDIEICNSLYNTFTSDILDTMGGLIMLKTYNSDEPIFINSLIFKLIKSKHYGLSVFVSKIRKDYVIIKENLNNKVVAVVKTKDYVCKKSVMGTQDKMALISKLQNYHNDKIVRGLSIAENNSSILGIGYIEKAQITQEDYDKLMKVSFKELKSVIRNINRSNYYDELNESEIIHKIIENRKSDYQEFVNGIKEVMNEKLKALNIIYNYFVNVGNEDKKNYYLDAINQYKTKIDKFVI